jgi:hypothetical protein
MHQVVAYAAADDDDYLLGRNINNKKEKQTLKATSDNIRYRENSYN